MQRVKVDLGSSSYHILIERDLLLAHYLHGIPVIHVPTRPLAQEESSVGGKTGINLRAAKTLVDAFYQPNLAVCALTGLNTLPERSRRAGLAEETKNGIISDVL